jgi:hypothetical protein
MNILIVDPAETPDPSRREYLQHHFASAAHDEVRFACGMLDSAWLLRHFNPDIVVLPPEEEHALLGRLFALRHTANPRMTLLRLDASAAGIPTDPALPQWPTGQRRTRGPHDLECHITLGGTTNETHD